MLVNRRDFVVGSAAAGLQGAAVPALFTPEHNVKAIAFDAFAILDPRPVVSRAQEVFPDRATELMNLWRTRQFEYTWLRSMMGQYADFWRVTDDALTFAAKSLKLELTADRRSRLMETYLELKTWPDALPTLHALKETGHRLAFLSNFTPNMLYAGIKNAGMEGLFEHVLSTDRVRAYKPSPRAYQMGIDAFRLDRSEILFVAFAGWDAAGARRFGYPTFWTNRLHAPTEELDIAPTAEATDLNELIRWLRQAGRAE